MSMPYTEPSKRILVLWEHFMDSSARQMLCSFHTQRNRDWSSDFLASEMKLDPHGQNMKKEKTNKIKVCKRITHGLC